MEINIDLISKAQEEYKKLEQLKSLLSNNQQAKQIPFKVGGKYFVRTVTYHAVIEVKSIVGDFIIGKYAWIADSGRYSDFSKTGVAKEVEPVHAEGGINVTTITDYFEWDKEVPSECK